jgi:hypothetical protein
MRNQQEIEAAQQRRPTDWLKLKKPTLAAKSYRIEQVNIEKHLKPVFGSLLLIDLTADDIAEYQRAVCGRRPLPRLSISSLALSERCSAAIDSGPTSNQTSKC